jgi:hypothetical protein
MNNSWARSSSSCLLFHKCVELRNVLYSGQLRKERNNKRCSFIYEIIQIYKDRRIFFYKNLYLRSSNDGAYNTN